MSILLVVADVMLVALLSMGFFMAQARIAGALDMAWVFAALTVTSLSFTALFFAHLRRPAMVGEILQKPGAAAAGAVSGQREAERARALGCDGALKTQGVVHL